MVPTFNRALSVQRLMVSFEALLRPDSITAELLIVDNGSTDNTATVLARAIGECTKFSMRVLQEDRQGKSSAVNRGLNSAQGKILLIIDDDVVVHPQWLIKHVESHSVTSFAAMQGRVLPGVDLNGRPADPNKLREYNIPIVDYGEDVCEIRGLLATNVSFKREVFEKVGFYDARLGVGASGFGEDTEFSMRIRKAGFKIGYTPHAVVYHELDPARYGRGYNRMAQYRKGVSRNFYRQDSIVFSVLPNLFVNCVRFGFYRILGKSQKAYKTEGRIMKYWGYLAGKMRRRHWFDSHIED
ncbi:MAG TPA: glycosyltransferase [Candidatus Binatia bacterium]|nr:glycosyltransferase [Candidatus Binatia bacterium]